MSPEEQLRILTEGDRWRAVEEHLGGDWNRISELFTIPRSVFDQWADAIELPHKRVLNEVHTWDGTYCIEQNGRWDVYVQERGIRIHQIGVFEDFITAKREALASNYLYGVPLK